MSGERRITFGGFGGEFCTTRHRGHDGVDFLLELTGFEEDEADDLLTER